MKLLAALEELMDALARGDAEESQRLVAQSAPLFESESRTLSPDELSRAMELHEACNNAALALRAKMLAELGDLARSRRAAQVYRAHR